MALRRAGSAKSVILLADIALAPRRLERFSGSQKEGLFFSTLAQGPSTEGPPTSTARTRLLAPRKGTPDTWDFCTTMERLSTSGCFPRRISLRLIRSTVRVRYVAMRTTCLRARCEHSFGITAA